MDKTGVARIGGIALIALGLLLYVVFGLMQGSPTDVGVYSVTIVPVVIGLGLVWRASDPAVDES